MNCFRYFQCQSKHGIFAQAGKVRKVSGPVTGVASKTKIESADVRKVKKEADVC